MEFCPNFQATSLPYKFQNFRLVTATSNLALISSLLACPTDFGLVSPHNCMSQFHGKKKPNPIHIYTHIYLKIHICLLLALFLWKTMSAIPVLAQIYMEVHNISKHKWGHSFTPRNGLGNVLQTQSHLRNTKYIRGKVTFPVANSQKLWAKANEY